MLSLAVQAAVVHVVGPVYTITFVQKQNSLLNVNESTYKVSKNSFSVCFTVYKMLAL